MTIVDTLPVLAAQSYRTRWAIDANLDPLGPRPTNLVQRGEWDAATAVLGLGAPAARVRSQDRDPDLRQDLRFTDAA